MSLRFRINLLITVLTLLFTGAVVKIVIDDTRRAIREEMEGSNRVTLQLLTTVVRDSAMLARTGEADRVLLMFLRELGRVRAHDIQYHDSDDQLIYASPPSVYKVGRWAPEWFVRLVRPAAARREPARARREHQRDRRSVAVGARRVGRPQEPDGRRRRVPRRAERARVLPDRPRAAAREHRARRPEAHGTRRAARPPAAARDAGVRGHQPQLQRDGRRARAEPGREPAGSRSSRSSRATRS
jgi:hypothetical protein